MWVEDLVILAKFKWVVELCYVNIWLGFFLRGVDNLLIGERFWWLWLKLKLTKDCWWFLFSMGEVSYNDIKIILYYENTIIFEKLDLMNKIVGSFEKIIEWLM